MRVTAAGLNSDAEDTESAAGLKPRAKHAKSCELGTETGPIFDARVRQPEGRNAPDRTMRVTAVDWPVSTNQTNPPRG